MVGNAPTEATRNRQDKVANPGSNTDTNDRPARKQQGAQPNPNAQPGEEREQPEVLKRTVKK